MVVILGNPQKEVAEKDLMQNKKAVVIEEKVVEEEVLVEKVPSKINLKPAFKKSAILTKGTKWPTCNTPVGA